MQNNQHYSTTVEDLEKAASVRLFEKAAAAEGINLADLSDSQVDELYSAYQSQSEENTMNDQIIDLFEKQAAYEGVDLESLNDEELAHVYNNFVTNLEAAEEAELEGHLVADEDDAAEKLAEAEILGRHMARAYHDEATKIASIEEAQEHGDLEDLIEVDFDEISAADLMSLQEDGYELIKEAGKMGQMAKYVDGKAQALGKGVIKQLRKSKKLQGKLGKKGQFSSRKAKRIAGYGTAAVGTAALGAGGMAAKKQMEKEAGAKDVARRVGKAVDDKAQALGKGVIKQLRKSKKLQGKLGKKGQFSSRKAKRIAGYGTAGVGALGVGGAGYAAKKQMEKEASYEDVLDIRAEEFYEFGKEAAYDGSEIDNDALVLLDELGFDITPVIEDYLE